MSRRRSPGNPWITLAILAALLAGAGYGWWRSEGGSGLVPGAGSAPASDGAPGSPIEPSPADEPAGPGAGGNSDSAPPLTGTNPLWPAIQPVDLTGKTVVPRPSPMAAEGQTGVIGVSADRLVFTGPTGERVEIFRLPPGYRWAGPIVPSPDGDAVAFLTRAEAGTVYLWVVRSDLTSTPYALPAAIDRPSAVAWAAPDRVAVGDPPHVLATGSGRWSRLPGGELAWTGPPSPDGRRWVYSAGPEAGGGDGGLYIADWTQDGVRPLVLDLEGGSQVAIPGPWLGNDALLAGIARPAPGSTGGTGNSPEWALDQLVRVELPGGEARAIFDGGATAWHVVGTSPDGRWMVLAEALAQQGSAAGATGGASAHGPAWRLLDVVTGQSFDLSSGLPEAGVAWDPEGRWLFYLANETGGALRLKVWPLPAGPEAPGAPGGEPDAGSGDEPAPSAVPDWQSWPPLQGAHPIRRLLAVDHHTAVAWVELQRDGDGDPPVAKWILPEGRLQRVW